MVNLPRQAEGTSDEDSDVIIDYMLTTEPYLYNHGASISRRLDSTAQDALKFTCKVSSGSSPSQSRRSFECLNRHHEWFVVTDLYKQLALVYIR
jgi:hypothetical protein